MSELGNHESGAAAFLENPVSLPEDLNQVFAEMDTIRAEKNTDDSDTPEQKLDLNLKALGVLVKHVEDSHLNLDEAIEAMKQNVAAQQEVKRSTTPENNDSSEKVSEEKEPVLLGSLSREQRAIVRGRSRTQPQVRPSAPLALTPDSDKAENPGEMPVVTNDANEVDESPITPSEAGGLLGNDAPDTEQAVKEESKEDRKKKLVKVVGAVGLMLGAALGRGESSAAAHESTADTSPAANILHQDEEQASSVNEGSGSLYTLGDETGSANSVTVTPVDAPPTATPAPEGGLASVDEAQSVGTSNTVDVGDSSMDTPNMPVDSGVTPADGKAHQEPAKESGWKAFFGFGGKGDNAAKS